MSPNNRRARSRHYATVPFLAFSLIMFVPAVPPAAGAEPTTLQVTLDNGASSVRTGDTLTYFITVRSQSNVVAHDLLLTQSIPATLEYVLADPGGTATSSTVSWDLDLDPNATRTFRTVMTVLAVPADLDQVTSMVCIATAVDAQPQMCATDTDQLFRAGGGDTAADLPTSPGLWWFVSASVVVLTIIAVVTVLVVKRRRSGNSE